jgi:hypothetical protein
MNVLVIPEDFRNDQYVLQPVIRALFQHLGRPNAKIKVCTDPLMGGLSQALNRQRLQEILERYGMIDLFLLCVDRDGQVGRAAELEQREIWMQPHLNPVRQQFLGTSAWQEIEVWALAGFSDFPQNWSWPEIRQEPNPKEVYFEKYAAQRGKSLELGAGRKSLGAEAARKYDRIRQLCPELKDLEGRIQTWLDRGNA